MRLKYRNNNMHFTGLYRISNLFELVVLSLRLIANGLKNTPVIKKRGMEYAFFLLRGLKYLYTSL